MKCAHHKSKKEQNQGRAQVCDSEVIIIYKETSHHNSIFIDNASAVPDQPMCCEVLFLNMDVKYKELKHLHN